MTAVLSISVILGTAVWFFRTAERLGLPGLAWAIGGMLVYYGGFLVWMYGILRAVMGAGFKVHGFWTGIGMDLSAILFGALCVALVRFRILMKTGPKPVDG